MRDRRPSERGVLRRRVSVRVRLKYRRRFAHRRGEVEIFERLHFLLLLGGCEFFLRRARFLRGHVLSFRCKRQSYAAIVHTLIPVC